MWTEIAYLYIEDVLQVNIVLVSEAVWLGYTTKRKKRLAQLPFHADFFNNTYHFLFFLTFFIIYLHKWSEVLHILQSFNCHLMENEYDAQIQATYRVKFIVFVLGIDIFDIGHNVGI